GRHVVDVDDRDHFQEDQIPAAERLFDMRAALAHDGMPPIATSFVSRYSSRPSAPASRPRPLSFQPTNGASIDCGVHSLTPTIPNSSRSAVRIAAARLF